MRETIIIIAIIAIILTGDISTKKYLSESSEELTEVLESLKQNTITSKQTNDREKIKSEIQEIEEKWDKTSNIWSMIAVHQEIDNIEQALTKAKSNVDEGNLEDALEEIETAIFFVEHVKEREKLSLKNIF